MKPLLTFVAYFWLILAFAAWSTVHASTRHPLAPDDVNSAHYGLCDMDDTNGPHVCTWALRVTRDGVAHVTLGAPVDLQDAGGFNVRIRKVVIDK